MKKIFVLFVGILLCLLPLASCKKPPKQTEAELTYYDQMTEGQDYNRDLFFQNDLTEKAADPSVIYVEEGEEKGYFYMYATSDQIGVSGYQAWRSKNLSDWECTGVAFAPDRNSWARQNYWAPEVIYYQTPAEKAAGTAGKYYMFYNAWKTDSSNRHSIGLAISDSPKGPFVQYTGTNTDGRVVGLGDAYIEPSLFTNMEIKNQPFIDASPFIDEDGKLYLYFTHDIQKGAPSSSIWGMELKDMFTPKYGTEKKLIEFNKMTVGGTTAMGETNNTNEAPFMYRKGDTYFLTFSVANFENPAYSVSQALGDSPLADFTKIAWNAGGRLLTYAGYGAEETYDHMSGTGHHSFIKIGEELFIAYHAFVDREGTIAEGRAIACDRVKFINNGEKEILYVNGPSYSLQPLAEGVSGYKNLSPLATVSATNIAQGSSTDYLKDGIYKNHNFAYIKEFEVNGNSTTITFKFDKKVNARAIMVYNAFDYLNSFSEIESIKIKNSVKVGDNDLSIYAVINNLKFPEKYIFTDKNDTTYKIMRPGGAAIAEFEEILTDEITITIKGGKEQDGVTHKLNVSDIVILGKEVV